MTHSHPLLTRSPTIAIIPSVLSLSLLASEASASEPPTSPGALELRRVEHVPELATPTGYAEITEIRAGWAIAGGLLAGTSWLASATAGVAMNDDEALVLLVPIAGPFVGIGTLATEGGGRAGLFLAGTAQAVGVAFLLVGLIDQETSLVTYADSDVTLIGHPGGMGVSVGF